MDFSPTIWWDLWIRHLRGKTHAQLIFYCPSTDLLSDEQDRRPLRYAATLSTSFNVYPEFEQFKIVPNVVNLQWGSEKQTSKYSGDLKNKHLNTVGI